MGNVECVSAERVAVLSDVHLGRLGAGYVCSVPDEALEALLSRLLGEVDLVVINGDLFDLDRGVVPLRRDAELEHIWAVHFPLVTALLGPRVHWTAGNHDALLVRKGLGTDALDVVTSRGRVRIEHGHRFDPWIKQQRTFTHLVTWTSGRVAGPKTEPLFQAMRTVERWLVGGSDEVPQIERAALAWLARTPEYVGMVVGHTHHAHHLDTPGGAWLVGSGQCMSAPITYAMFDAGRGTVTTCASTAGTDHHVTATYPWTGAFERRR